MKETEKIRSELRKIDILAEEEEKEILEAAISLLRTMPREMFKTLMIELINSLDYILIEYPEEPQKDAIIIDAKYKNEDDEIRTAKIMLVQSLHAPTAFAIEKFSAEISTLNTTEAFYISTGEAPMDYKLEELNLTNPTRLFTAQELMDILADDFDDYTFGIEPERLVITPSVEIA